MMHRIVAEEEDHRIVGDREVLICLHAEAVDRRQGRGRSATLRRTLDVHRLGARCEQRVEGDRGALAQVVGERLVRSRRLADVRKASVVGNFEHQALGAPVGVPDRYAVAVALS